MHLFRSVTPQMARDAYISSATDIDMKRSLSDERARIQSDIARGQKAYEGGSNAVEELMRRWNETPAEWSSRRNHYRNVPVVRQCVDTLAWLLYGAPPSFEVWIGERPATLMSQMQMRGQDTQSRGETTQVDQATSDLSDFVNMTLEENRNAALMLRAARQRIRDGIAVVKVWGVDESGVPSLPFSELRMDVHKAGDCIPIYDPDDPDIMLAMAEYRHGQWILWTTDTVDMVDPDLTIRGTMGQHPLPGVIPFAVLGDGHSLIDDLVEYQKVLINRHSLLWGVERACAFPTGVMSGDATNQEKIPEGAESFIGQPKAIDIGGGTRYLHFADPQGGFTWVSPTADRKSVV